MRIGDEVYIPLLRAKGFVKKKASKRKWDNVFCFFYFLLELLKPSLFDRESERQSHSVNQVCRAGLVVFSLIYSSSLLKLNTLDKVFIAALMVGSEIKTKKGLRLVIFQGPKD